MPEIFTSYSPELAAVSLPTWVDLASVIVGSASGILVARSRHLDAVGFVGLALLCGLGGGLIRDVMMQVGSVYMLDSSFAIPASAPMNTPAMVFFTTCKMIPPQAWGHAVPDICASRPTGQGPRADPY